MNDKAFSDAAVAYEKYIKVLEIIFDAKPGELSPEQFKDAARTQELTVVASAYWDLLRIYDTSEKYGDRQAIAAKKLAQFKIRKNRYLQGVVDGPKTEPHAPITAVGGPKVWLDSIKDSYLGCLQRSIHMAKELTKVTSNNHKKICHIGGNLHLKDMKYYLSKQQKPPNEINVVSLKNKKKLNHIIWAMSKEIETDIDKKEFGIEINSKLEEQLNVFFKSLSLNKRSSIPNPEVQDKNLAPSL
jgi:hypothetical protein